MKRVLFPLLCLLVACGGSVAQDVGGPSSTSSSSSGGSGSSSGGSSGSSGSTSSGGNGPCSSKPPVCPWVCGGTTAAQCTDTGWKCPPPPPGPLCPNDCSNAPPIDCFCGAPTCTNGQWTCSSSCVDAGSSFPCGNQACAPGSFCADTAPGIAYPDGGTPPDYLACYPIPSACLATPTCACVVNALKQGGSSCVPDGCTEDAAGHVTVGCMGM